MKLAPNLSREDAAALTALRRRLHELQGVVVAYSGGADSTLLAMVAYQELGDRMLAVTADSEIYPTHETQEARRIAKELGFAHRIIQTQEIQRPEFAENSPLRCYHCKRELFAQIFRVAEELELPHVVDGLHYEDRDDYRPGSKAARELGIISPLMDLRFRKDTIRNISHWLGLPTWNKPPHPCLSTRFPYGKKITAQELSSVEAAEEFLRALGAKNLRLRHHGDIARLEVSREDMGLFLDPEINQRVVAALKGFGYRYVTLDLEGYRTGSMNEALKPARTPRLRVLDDSDS